MNTKTRKLSAMVVVCMLLASAENPVLAEKHQDQPPPPLFTGSIGPSTGEIVGIAVGIAAVGAALGVGIYFAVKHSHSMTGCARTTADGLTLTTESDKQTFALIGDVAGIKPGNRVRVSGKKSKEKSGGTSQFLVEKVSKDLGRCDGGPSGR
jgi:hypothetical protein